MVKKLKDLVRQNPEPARGKSGTDPMDPWGAKANLAEGGLDTYLLSRGIDPKRVSRETKISHAKSSTYQKWKRDHTFESVESTEAESITEDKWLDKFLMSRGINPKYVNKNMKVAHAKSGEFIKWKNDHQFESVVVEETDEKDMVCFDIPLLIRVLEFTREEMSSDIELHNMVERLINMRHDVPLDMTHYDEITQKLVKENHIAIAMGKMLDDESGMVLSQIEELERGCAMIRSYIGKDYEKQLPAWVQAKVTLATDYMSTVGNYLVSKNEKVNEETKPTSLEKFRKASAEREAKHKEIEKNQSKDGSGMTSAIDRLEKHMNKEEVEQIDELKKTTVFSWLKKQPVVPEKKPGMSRKDHNQRIKIHNKNWNSALDRLSGYKPTSENTLDPLAATEAPADGANCSNDTTMKSQLSKSARMIKALYKKKGMKEETYDWEKDDKAQSYGKKPKIQKPEGQDNMDMKKPDASVVMSGGKTLTGTERDTVQIDPLLNTRPAGPDQFEKPVSKKDK